MGDRLVLLGSSGLHSNGYSLFRHVLDGAGWALDREVAELGRTVGEELLEPTTVYARDCLALAAGVEVHAMAHVTGGGLAANLARVLPVGLAATIDRGTWSLPPIFSLVGTLGAIDERELEATLNMGVGMVAVVAPDASDAAVALLADRGVPAWIGGSIESAQGTGGAVLVGSYA